MKIKEEIEQLANKRYLQKAEAITDSTIKGFIVSATKGGFIDGYTQCQQDMADKKYTEEEVIELLQKALTHQNDAEIGNLVTTQKEIRPANFYSWFNKFKKP
jgi:hypothetical protein